MMTLDDDNGDTSDPIVTMVCHQTLENHSNQDERRPSSMVCHSIESKTQTLNNIEAVSESEDDYECEDEEGSAVTYSFTLGNNVPLVVQTVTSETASDKTELNAADNEVDITIIAHDEADDIVAEPLTSKFVVNFRNGSKEPEDLVQSTEESSKSNIEKDPIQELENNIVEPEIEKSSTKRKILNILFGCFRLRRNKCKD